MTQSSKEVKIRYQNSEKGKARKRAYYEAHKGKWQAYERDRQLRKTYGITSADYERILADQNGRCKICGSVEGKAGRLASSFAVDHCHTTGRVRGLLCNRCNVAVGFYELHADKVMKYLQES